MKNTPVISEKEIGLCIDYQKICEVLTRYAVAIDSKNYSLLKSCFTFDAEVDYGPEGGKHSKPDEIVKIVRSFVEGLDSTQHLTGTYQINVDGDSAFCTSYVQAQHYLKEAKSGTMYTLGGIYYDKVIRTDDGWKIQNRRLETLWTTGNTELFNEVARIRNNLLVGKRILAVDDEPDVLETIEDLLPQCDIVKATNFEEAKRILETEKIDLAILDIMGVDGYSLLDIAKDKKVTAVMLTAHEKIPKGIVVSYSKGAASYIPKEMLADIARYLNDVMRAELEGKDVWGSWLRNFKSYFDQKSGKEVDWKKEYKKFWEKMYHI